MFHHVCTSIKQAVYKPPLSYTIPFPCHHHATVRDLTWPVRYRHLENLRFPLRVFMEDILHASNDHRLSTQDNAHYMIDLCAKYSLTSHVPSVLQICTAACRMSSTLGIMSLVHGMDQEWCCTSTGKWPILYHLRELGSFTQTSSIHHRGPFLPWVSTR